MIKLLSGACIAKNKDNGPLRAHCYHGNKCKIQIIFLHLFEIQAEIISIQLIGFLLIQVRIKAKDD